MIIELAGLPASGKSTMAERLSSDGAGPIIKIRSRYKLMIYNIWFVFAHPIFSLVTMRYIIKNSNTASLFYYKFMNAFLHHNAKFIESQRLQKGIIDEGHAQNVYSIFEYEQSEEFIKRYIKKMPRSDKLIILHPSEETLMSRVKIRGYRAREQFGSTHYQNNWYSQAKKNQLHFISAVNIIDGDFEIIEKD
jgi:deoxyadenosine/deoxycytidine kinase